ncbi:MAG TPA: hypothetical protein VEA41_20960 [Salinarimonas sp.]|nr:hypothetical protein [Salinarimonas sp.]
MSDPIPAAPKKPVLRRERVTRSAPTVEALASVVRAAEGAKPVTGEAATVEPARVEPPAPRPVAEVKAEPTVEARVEAKVEPARPAPGPIPAAGAVRARALLREHGPLAAALAMALGLGWVSGLATMIHARPAEVPPAPAALVLEGGMSAPLAIRSGGDAARLSGEVKAMTGALATLRASQEAARADAAARLARLEKAEAEAASRLGQVLERVAAARDGEAAFGAILDRLDRLERVAAAPAPAPTPAAVQTASLPASPAPVAAPVIAPPAAPVPAPAVTGALPESRASAPAPEARPAEKAAAERTEIVPGWYLRGVHRGVALVEGRRGLVEVRQGEVIPGVGRVEAIERRGREWVVLTARGVITTESW